MASNNEVRATAKWVRVSPSKARLVVDLIRNKSVAQAFEILQFCDRHVAVDVEKVLRSAVANAENNNGMRADNLVVAATYVDEGPTLKRFRPRAQGRGYRIYKRTSHITVIVSDDSEGGTR